MAQFDVHDLAGTLVVDCQSDLLARLETRLVVPLVPSSSAPPIAQRLNPVFEIGGQDFVMFTQAASAVQRRELGDVVQSLSQQSFEITGAIDVLISGV